MGRRARILLLIGVAAAAGLGYWASQNVVVRNLARAISYERTLDAYAQVDTTVTDVDARIDAAGREAGLISAFYGLDDGLPHLIDLVACRGAGGMDGMPVIFSHEVDIATLEPGDLRVTTASGAVGEVVCLTLAPADDPGERRTALVIGQYGDAVDQPAMVEIVGNVLSIDGALNFRGASVAVTPLESGPSLVWAERVPESAWALGREATRLPWGGGDGCPEGVAQVVRVTWDGGVSKPGGGEADAGIGQLYEVSVAAAGGPVRVVRPVALANLGDGDNNHDLCLDTADPAQSVRFPAGGLKDPRADLNDDTEVAVANTGVVN